MSANDPFGDGLSTESQTGRSTSTLHDHDSNFTMKYIQRFSPRSVEACAREGVLPEELIPLAIEEMDFDPADSQAVRKLRFEHAEQRRQELLRIARQARQKLVDSKWQPPPDLDKIMKKKVPVDTIQKIIGGATAEMIESEKSRLQKLITRHEKELEQLLKSEMKTLTLEERQKQKELALKMKEEALAKQRMKMKQEILEKAKQMQQRRAEEEEKEILRRKQLQQEIYEKAMKAQQEQVERRKQRRLEARMKAEERFARQQKFRQRSDAMNESISQRILSKLQMMQIRDEMRRKKAEDHKKMAQTMEEKARLAREKKDRVERALSLNQRKIDEKRLQLAQQMEAQSKQQDNFAHNLQVNYSEMQKQKRESDLRRAKAKEEADRRLQRKIYKVLDKNRKAEARKREMELDRLEQQELKKEQQRLRIQDKLMNVERKKRIDEYRRVHIATKIEQDFERSRILQRVRSDMIQERKRNSVLAQIQKEQIVKTFHQLHLSDGHQLVSNSGRPQSAVVSASRPAAAGK